MGSFTTISSDGRGGVIADVLGKEIVLISEHSPQTGGIHDGAGDGATLGHCLVCRTVVSVGAGNW
jgi:hypothetical protein